MRSNVVMPHSSRGSQIPDPRYAPYPGYQMPDPQSRPSRPVQPQPRRRLVFSPAEGWSSMFFLTIAIYCIVYTIISANWVNNTYVLTWTTAVGLLLGFLVAKIDRMPQSILHLGACLVGHWLSIWLTSYAFGVSWMDILGNLRSVLAGNVSPPLTANSEMVFLFYLSFLSFFLGYFGAWLTFRAHLPWLVAFVYCSILLVNLNYVKKDLTLIVLILLGALVLLIARVQLVAQLTQWKIEGLHTDRSWLKSLTNRLMYIASVLTLLALLISWILPITAQPGSGVTFWDRLDNAWNNISHGHISWQDPRSLFNPYQVPANFFGDSLSISGSVNLPQGDVLYYTSSAAPQYLQGFTYDHFDGHTWISSLNNNVQNYNARVTLPADTQAYNIKQISTVVTVLQPPGGTKNYIFGPSQPFIYDVATTLYGGDITTAWTKQSPLVKGEQYTVVSDVSTASARDLSRLTLSAIKLFALKQDANYAILSSNYLQVPDDLSPNVQKTLQDWTMNAHTVFDALKMLESHLNDTAKFTYSLNNPPVPANIDAVDWLLQTRRGYCTYYASAMIVMARMLGIPTRMANGFSQGTFDAVNKRWVVTGADAHSWVQAYFPGYGWINFDPTPGYTINSPAGVQSTPTPSPTAAPTQTASPTVAATQSKVGVTPTATPHATLKSSTQDTSITGNLFLGLTIVVFCGSLLFLLYALVTYWWRNLYADRSFIAGLYLRLCRLASWAGLAPRDSQTPFEYGNVLSRHLPEHSSTLWRLTELYVRDLYAAPTHAPHTAEEEEVARRWPSLWRNVVRLLVIRPRRDS